MSSFKEIVELEMYYFSKLFTLTSSGANFDTIIKNGEFNYLSDDDQIILQKLFFPDEVESAFKDMHPLKSHGLDGIHAGFYHTYWHPVGKGITKLILKCLNGDLCITNLNENCIVLILKIHSPKSMNDFHPLSMCNVMYKPISKIIVKRLKEFPKLINFLLLWEID